VGLAALLFPPSAGAIADDGQVTDWTLDPIRNALKAGLLPVVYGDVAFDRTRGGTILSTEDLFDYLARQLRPRRILLAGLEPGVWADYPERKRIIPEITSANIGEVLPAVKAADAVDVTGGMASKVAQSLELVEAIAGLDVLIFSGAESGALRRALSGEKVGTVIKRPPEKLI
jgi:isopentenyl phosphate kinase